MQQCTYIKSDPIVEQELFYNMHVQKISNFYTYINKELKKTNGQLLHINTINIGLNKDKICLLATIVYNVDDDKTKSDTQKERIEF